MKKVALKISCTAILLAASSPHAAAQFRPAGDKPVVSEQTIVLTGVVARVSVPDDLTQLYSMSALSRLLNEPEKYHDLFKTPEHSSSQGPVAETPQAAVKIATVKRLPRLLRPGQKAELVVRIDSDTSQIVSFTTNKPSVGFLDGGSRIDVLSRGGPDNTAGVWVVGLRKGPYEIVVESVADAGSPR